MAAFMPPLALSVDRASGSGGPKPLPTPPDSPISEKWTVESNLKLESRLPSRSDSMVRALKPIDLPQQCFRIAFASWPQQSVLENKVKESPGEKRLTLKDCVNDRGLVGDDSLLYKREGLGRERLEKEMLVWHWYKRHRQYQNRGIELPPSPNVPVVLPGPPIHRHLESLQSQAIASTFNEATVGPSKQNVQRLQRQEREERLAWMAGPGRDAFNKTAPPTTRTASLLTRGLCPEAKTMPAEMLRAIEEARHRAAEKPSSRNKSSNASQTRDIDSDTIKRGGATTGTTTVQSRISRSSEGQAPMQLPESKAAGATRGLAVNPSDRPEVHIGG